MNIRWCRRRDSNSHTQRAGDFESPASTNSATSANLKVQSKYKFYYEKVTSPQITLQNLINNEFLYQ